MGLDITAYRNIKQAEGVVVRDHEPVDKETGEYVDGVFVALINPDFPGCADTLKDGGAYEYEESDSIRAGSYGGYNQWRERLAAISGWPAVEYDDGWASTRSHAASAWRDTEGPFWELIYFSDCGGVMGAATAAKIAADFAAFQASADAVRDDSFRQKYNEWRRLFEMAADNGALEFS